MENYRKKHSEKLLQELNIDIIRFEEHIQFLKDTKQELEEELKKLEEYRIRYPEECFTWAEGGTIHAEYPDDTNSWSDLGEVRATEEQAEEAIRRNIRGNRLEALAHSIGGVYDFQNNDKNFFIVYDSKTLKAKVHWSLDTFSAERVYMTEETAWKVVEILNSGVYKLVVKVGEN